MMRTSLGDYEKKIIHRLPIAACGRNQRRGEGEKGRRVEGEKGRRGEDEKILQITKKGPGNLFTPQISKREKGKR